MFDRPPRRFRSGGFVSGPDGLDRKVVGLEGRVENTRHDVEAAVERSPRFDRVRGQPGMRAAPQSTLLAFIDRLGRIAVSAHAPTLDLDENEQSAATRDQVDLDSICADVACDDAIPSVFEESGGSSFALASEPLTVIRHVATHRSAPICRTG